MKIYQLEIVNNCVVKAFNKLIPQFSTNCKLPNKKDVESIINRNNTIIFVVEDNNEIVGNLSLVKGNIPTGNKTWIEDVVIDKSFRGRGLGKELINFAI